MRPYRLLLAAALIGLSSGAAAASEPTDVRVQKIALEGLEDSNPRLVLRELPFQPGTRWQPEMKAIAERRLRNLGLFRNVVVHDPDDAGTVVVEAHERWSLWVLPRVSRKDDGSSEIGVNLDEYNLWGLGHHIRVAMDRDTGKNFSSGDGHDSYAVSYHWSRIADTRLGLGLAYNQSNTSYVGFDAGQSVANYREQQHDLLLDLNYGLGPVAGEGWSVHGGLVRANTSFTQIDGMALPDVGDSRATNLIAGVSYTLIDNHITWLSGQRFNYDLSQGIRTLGSDQNTFSHTFSWRKYRHLGQGRTVNFRIDGGQIIGDSQRNARFDLGNRDQMRGYFPGEVLATRYLYGTVEGRFPPEPDSNFFYVAFIDTGHLSDRGEDPLRHALITGLGGGIRWTFRWLVHGTLRLDLAYGEATHNLRLYLGTGQTF